MKQPAVFLVGAGPGDPGLITSLGLERLRTADVIIHDHSVPARLLKHARPNAELIDVGQTSDEAAQQAISILIAEKAREDKLVVRLKRGDPFVFDRGGEEALFLREHGIPFEVVPGIPAAIGAAAYAGVPVWYSGGGDTITLVRAYGEEGRKLPDVDWASLVKLEGTLICYAGGPELPRVLDALRSNGWPLDGEAVIVYGGTTAAQETIAGTLEELLVHAEAHVRRTTAILIAGRVVGFREHLRWYDSRPLFGRRVLITRPREQAAELADRLAALGAETIEAPMIRIAPADDLAPLRRAAENVDAFDWIVFTSGNGVEAFMNVLLDGTRDLRALKGPLLCAVGTGTAERLMRFGLRVDLLPTEFRSEGVIAALEQRGSLDGARILLPRGDIARDVVADELRERGALVTDIIAYRTLLDDSPRDEDPDIYGLLLQGKIDVVTFTSASAVRNFARVYGPEQSVDLLRNTVVAAIGPVTAEAATQLGIAVTVQPATYTVPALVDAIAARFSPAHGTATQRT